MQTTKPPSDGTGHEAISRRGPQVYIYTYEIEVDAIHIIIRTQPLAQAEARQLRVCLTSPPLARVDVVVVGGRRWSAVVAAIKTATVAVVTGRQTEERASERARERMRKRE